MNEFNIALTSKPGANYHGPSLFLTHSILSLTLTQFNSFIH